MDELARAAEVLRLGPEVALACHVNPDADALGSMLGLSAFLRARGTHDGVLVPERAAEAAALGLVPARGPTTWWRSPITRTRPPSWSRATARRSTGSVRSGPRRERRRGHLDRPSPFERRAGHDPAGRPGRIVHVRDGVPADRADGRRDAGRDRRLPVRRPRHRHRPVPVRGDHARDAPRRRRAPRAPVRSRAAGAGAVRGQPPRVPAASRRSALGAGHGRARRRTSSGPT